jgi:hypothetical protein
MMDLLLPVLLVAAVGGPLTLAVLTQLGLI